MLEVVLALAKKASLSVLILQKRASPGDAKILSTYLSAIPRGQRQSVSHRTIQWSNSRIERYVAALGPSVMTPYYSTAHRWSGASVGVYSPQYQQQTPRNLIWNAFRLSTVITTYERSTRTQCTFMSQNLSTPSPPNKMHTKLLVKSDKSWYNWPAASVCPMPSLSRFLVVLPYSRTDTKGSELPPKH